MKTLQKLTMMAFAVLSAGFANAQNTGAPHQTCSNCTPPTISQPPHANRPPCPSCSSTTTFNAQSAINGAFGSQPTPNVNSINSSSVYQRGTNQFACVEQVYGDNVATLVQDAGSTAAIGHNDAYQYQYNPRTTDNLMYGAQTGNNNLLVQRQYGEGNFARAEQSGNRNIGVQSQGAAGNESNSSYAMLTQSSSDNKSVQYQRGTSNVSDVAQYDWNGSWSATTQLGSNNSVVVNQH